MRTESALSWFLNQEHERAKVEKQENEIKFWKDEFMRERDLRIKSDIKANELADKVAALEADAMLRERAK